MFYCEACAEIAKWPQDFWLLRSHGQCEMCGVVAPCFDVPSRSLPNNAIPHKNFLRQRVAQFRAGEHEIQEEP